MKNISIVLLIFCTSCLFSGCEDYFEETPTACFEILSYDAEGNTTVTTIAKAGEAILFKKCEGNDATHYAIWTGDEGHVYQTQDNIGSGVDLTGEFEYAYSEPGTYEVVWIATNDFQEQHNQSETKQTITISE